MLDMTGEFSGINTALFSETGGNVGIGFAIPINMAKDLLPQLKKGKVVRGWLGLPLAVLGNYLAFAAVNKYQQRVREKITAQRDRLRVTRQKVKNTFRRKPGGQR